MALEILADLLAGLGLFVIGVRFIAEHMKQMAGRGFRRMAGYLTCHPGMCALSGLAAGLLVQSTNAVTFIVSSLVSSRLITVRKGMPIVTWSNVGVSLIVLVSVLDLHLVALYVVGMVGAFYYLNFDRRHGTRALLGAFLGLGLLLTGLIFIKAGAAPLKEVRWLSEVLSQTRESYVVPFILAAAVTAVAQSSMTVAVIAIALARSGLLGVDQTVMIIYGANVGSAISVLVLSAKMTGMARQLAVFQAAFKISGSVVLVPLFYAGLWFGLPGIQSAAEWLTNDLGHQMAMVFLLYQVVSAGIVSASPALMERFIERVSPTTTEETLSRTQFIYDKALDEPETALELAEQEHLRLVRHLPEHLDALREETRAGMAVSSETLQGAVSGVTGRLKEFITELIDRHESRDCLDRAMNLQERSEILCSISGSLHEFVVACRPYTGLPCVVGDFSARSSEVLHLLLVCARESMVDKNRDSHSMLLELTSDRGERMVEVRRSLLGQRQLNLAEQQVFVTVTALFERITWLLRRYALLVRPPSLSA